MLKKIRVFFIMSLIVGLGLVFHVSEAAANTKTITRIDMMTMGQMLSKMGLSYQSTSTDKGQPLMKITSRDLPFEQFEIYFFGCNAERACKSITLWSWYKPRIGVNYSLVNEWNRRNRWVRGYLDEDLQPVLEMDIHAEGGLGEHNLYLLVNAYVQTTKAYARTMRVIE